MTFEGLRRLDGRYQRDRDRSIWNLAESIFPRIAGGMVFRRLPSFESAVQKISTESNQRVCEA